MGAEGQGMRWGNEGRGAQKVQRRAIGGLWRGTAGEHPFIPLLPLPEGHNVGGWWG